MASSHPPDQPPVELEQDQRHVTPYVSRLGKSSAVGPDGPKLLHVRAPYRGQGAERNVLPVGPEATDAPVSSRQITVGRGEPFAWPRVEHFGWPPGLLVKARMMEACQARVRS